MGSSASIKQDLKSDQRADSNKRSRDAGDDAANLFSEYDVGQQKTSRFEHSTSLLFLHAFAARIECDEKGLDQRGFFSLHENHIEEKLDVLDLPELDINRYWTSVASLAGTSFTGIPTLELPISQIRVHGGLYPFVSPLMQAVLHSNLDAVEVLINFGADVNTVTHCDVPYYRSDLPVLQRGTSVLMIALYKLYDIYEYSKSNVTAIEYSRSHNQEEDHYQCRATGSRTLAEEFFHTKRMKSLLICSALLNLEHVDVMKGFVNSAGDLITAATIASALIEAVRTSRVVSSPYKRSTKVHLLQRICDRILARALRSSVRTSSRNANASSDFECKIEIDKLSDVKFMTTKVTPSVDSIDIDENENYSNVFIDEQRI